MRTGRGRRYSWAAAGGLPYTMFCDSIHSPSCPHDSGPLQWALGNCALKRSVTARPDRDGLRWRKKRTSAPITPIRPLLGDSAPLVAINTKEKGCKDNLFILGTSRTVSTQAKKIQKNPRERDSRQRGQGPKSLRGEPYIRLGF